MAEVRKREGGSTGVRFGREEASTIKRLASVQERLKQQQVRKSVRNSTKQLIKAQSNQFRKELSDKDQSNE